MPRRTIARKRTRTRPAAQGFRDPKLRRIAERTLRKPARKS